MRELAPAQMSIAIAEDRHRSGTLTGLVPGGTAISRFSSLAESGFHAVSSVLVDWRLHPSLARIAGREREA